MELKRNQLIAAALASHRDVDAQDSSCHGGADIPTLYSSITNAKPSDEVLKWLSFAETFSQDHVSSMNQLNQHLASNSVVLGRGISPSEVDIIVFAVVYSSMTALPLAERDKLKYILRWMSYIQGKFDFRELFVNMNYVRPHFDFDTPLRVVMSTQRTPKSDAECIGKNSVDLVKDADNVKKSQNSLRRDDKDVTQDKKEQSNGLNKNVEGVDLQKDAELSVSLLNMQVGIIRKAWKHSSADSLLVEEIDVGEAKPRQVVSGLAKYYSPDELKDRRVVLVTNVKPGKLRDVVSEGLVLCASSKDHSIVDPLLPPQGAPIGERISFSGIDGKPEDVLNPKKKQLEKIVPNLFTDENCVATFKGVPFMTSAGPCMSSLALATIK